MEGRWKADGRQMEGMVKIKKGGKSESSGSEQLVERKEWAEGYRGRGKGQ
jgi:hypothetical protein